MLDVPKNAFVDPLGFEGRQVDGLNQEAFLSQSLAEFNLNAAFLSVFSSDNGKKVLDFLIENTIHAPAWRPSLVASMGLEAANATGYAREGANALVRDIMDRMELAEKCKGPEDLGKLKQTRAE